MSLTVAVAQTNPGGDLAQNFDTIRAFTKRAADQGAALVVFPEEAMLLAEDDIKERFPEILPDAWPQFESLIKELATTHDIAIIAAGYEPTEAGVGAYNTIVAYNRTGKKLAHYHKVHLYDAYSYKESEYVNHGSDLPPIIEIDGVRIGIANCYDLRFPELFRSLADRGVDVIALSAAWVSGPGKEDHWNVLSSARAIENVSWFLASGTVSEDTVGLSKIVDPLGVTVASLNGHDEGLIIADLDETRTSRAREILPALQNRRMDTTIQMKGH